MDPATIMMLVKKFGPMAVELLGGQMSSGPTPGQTGPNPNAGPSKFSLGIKDGMKIPPRNEAPGGGFSLGLPGGEGESFLSPGPTDHMKSLALGGPPSGNVFDSAAPKVGGGDVAGGGASALEKLGMGAQVGEALMPKPPPPPSLPGGGRFDMENTIMQWLQSMGRR